MALDLNWRATFDDGAGIDLAHFPDDFTRDHFRLWLGGYMSQETRCTVGQHIAGLTRNNPDLIGRAWSELRDIA